MGSITDIIWLDISELRPYENNSKKHSEKQLQMIAKSIEEFGFLSPLLIDENNNIITGHGRTLAATLLGFKTVPCVRVEGLTEDQRRAYIIADNKLTEVGGWDKDLVAAELSLLDINGFDVDITGFKITDIKELELETPKVYGAERERTANAYNMNLTDTVDADVDFWQMPVIADDGFIPDQLIGFNYAKTSKEKNVGIHFYLDDYQFERVWNNPEKYIEVLADYDCILSPDFSLYLDMPMPMKIWNVYRSRQIGAFYQSKGIKVIPTISWAEESTFAFCFNGIPVGSTVSISTIGVKDNSEAFDVWKNGVSEMIKRIQPKSILVYGGEVEFDYGDINVIYFDNKVLKRWEKKND